MKQALANGAVAALLGVGLGALPALADRSPLAPGIDTGQVRRRLGHPIAPTACPPVPPPIVDMGGIVSRYDPKDPTQSRIDPGRDAAARAQEAGLSAFAKQVDQLSDRALVAAPADAALGACIMSHLAVWARANALGANIEANDRVGRDQAVMEQAWYGAAFASVVAKLGGFDAVPGSDSEAVKAWLRGLATSVMQTYSGLSGLIRPANNHRYWAGYAVAATGVLLDDRAMLAFGRTVLHDGLGTVAADGSLPAEMARGRKALIYQYFASLPLAGLVAIADRNGLQLDEREEGALERMVGFDLSAADDQGRVEALARAGQDPAVTGFALGWIDVLTAHMERCNMALAERMSSVAARPGMRPAWFIFLGGDVSTAYNPGAITKPR